MNNEFYMNYAEDPTLYDFALFGVGANGENIQKKWQKDS